MHILGLSGATKVISLGLTDNDRLLCAATMADLQSERIMFYVKEAGIKPEEIEGVAVAAGPGSYSGLRGGVSAAKALAQTLNIPLAGVSTLEAIAYNLIEIEGTMAVILDARADEYNFALFAATRGRLKRLTDDLVINCDALLNKLSRITGEIHLVGNLATVKEKLREDNYHFAGDLHAHPYGQNVARLGLESFKSGRKDEYLSLIPGYSHQPGFREFKN